MIGETGSIIGHRPRDGYAIVPGAIILLGIVLAVFFAGRTGRRAAGVGLLIGGGTAALAVGAALAGRDYVVARNLLPALVPLLLVAAAGFAACRWRRAGLALAGVLCAYWLAFAIHVDTTPSLQRPDWRDLAAKIDTSPKARAIVAWKLAAAPLEYYLHGDAGRLTYGRARASEVDVIFKPQAARRGPAGPLGFHRDGQVREDRLTLVRYSSPRPRTVRFSDLRRLRTGFRVNSILLDVGPRATRLDHIANTLSGTVS